jgi:hypothetical protein
MIEDRSDYLFTRALGDGRVIDVIPLLFGRARLAISANNATSFIDDVWEYDLPAVAIEEAERWSGDGEPARWMRHPKSGRRRPDGDPEREFIRP